MKFKTAISQTKDGRHSIRGKDLVELIQQRSFVEVVFLLLRGDLPKENEGKLLDAMLVASAENGVESPSAYVPRVAAASGNQMHTALAAGILAVGEKHGGAGEKAAKFLADHKGEAAEAVIADHAGEVLPGFGHKVYTDGDPRAQALCEKARELGVSTEYFDFAWALEAELAKRKGKKIPLNIDGAIAAIMLDLGFDWRLGKAFFLISRIVGMSAHVLEELSQDNSYYRLHEEDVEYEKGQ